MDTKRLAHGNYQFLIDYFGEEVLKARYETVYAYLDEFIESRGLQDEVFISENILDNIIVDYFVDIYRIKTFQNIDDVNETKIYAYTAYWLLRRKPLQLKKTDSDNQLCFINEQMAAEFIYSFIFSQPSNVALVPEKKEQFNEFENNLLYSFIYRMYNPQMLETLIYAFTAGRAYQYSIDFDN